MQCQFESTIEVISQRGLFIAELDIRADIEREPWQSAWSITDLFLHSCERGKWHYRSLHNDPQWSDDPLVIELRKAIARTLREHHSSTIEALLLEEESIAREDRGGEHEYESAKAEAA